MTIPSITRDSVAEYYKKGYSTGRIADKFNISSTSVRRILKEKNIERRDTHETITEKEVKEIYDRIKNGEHIYEVAKDKFVTPSAISHLLKRRGYRK